MCERGWASMSALPPKADIPERNRHDRNYVAFQALLSPWLQLFGWFANDYCAPGKILLPMLTANRLRKVLSYAPATGIFRWKVSASTRAPVGTIAGAKNGRGYRQIRIDGQPYSASRLEGVPRDDRCPLWVKSRHSVMFGECPLSPQK